MGYDLYTWKPLVNTWDVPGSTTLAGTLDTGNPSQVIVGDTSGFPALTVAPSIAQINASSGLNQVRAAINRRLITFATSFGFSLGGFVIPYLVAGTIPKASDFTATLSAINSLRNIEGWIGGNLVWPISTPTVNNRIFGHHLAFLRKGLSIAGSIKMAFNLGGIGKFGEATPSQFHDATSYQYVRQDNPTYNTHVQEQILSTGSVSLFTGAFIGKQNNNSAGMYRYRLGMTFNIPEWMSNGITSAEIGLQIISASNALETDFSEAYAQDPAFSGFVPPILSTGYNGTFYSVNKIIASIFPIFAPQFLLTSCFVNNIIPYAGKRLFLMLGKSNEINNIGAGAGGGVSTQGSIFGLESSIYDSYLQLDF